MFVHLKGVKYHDVDSRAILRSQRKHVEKAKRLNADQIPLDIVLAQKNPAYQENKPIMSPNTYSIMDLPDRPRQRP